MYNINLEDFLRSMKDKQMVFRLGAGDRAAINVDLKWGAALSIEKRQASHNPASKPIIRGRQCCMTGDLVADITI